MFLPAKHTFRKNQLVALTRLLLGMAFFSAGLAFAAAPNTQPVAALLAAYASLGERLHQSAFRRALVLDSSESTDGITGDIYALVDYPFETVRAALDNPAQWCDVMILHVNTKYCRAASDHAPTIVTVYIGKKTPQPVDDAYPIEFVYRLNAAAAKYLDIRLTAANGPMSTRNYRIQLQAVPVGNGQTFLHLTYSYDFGLAGRLAMKTYLTTIGRDKVGFTLMGTPADGPPEYIGGMRGVVERNTMRYYLAIEAYLGALATPPALQLQKRLQSWFTAPYRTLSPTGGE